LIIFNFLILSLILVFKSPKLNFILIDVAIVLKAERINTTAGGTVTADNTSTVELRKILNVTNVKYNILTVLYFFFVF